MPDQSVQSNILDLAVAALPGAFRCRFRDFGSEELPARNVVPETEEPVYDSTGDVTRTFRFTVRHTVAAVDSVDKIADQAYVETSQQLCSDEAFRQSVRMVREMRKRWESERGELQQMTLSVTFEVEFSTSPADPSVPGF